MGEGFAEYIQTRMEDAYGLDIDMSSAIVGRFLAVANAAVVFGLEILHWIRKMKYRDDVRLPRGLPKIVHHSRMSQTDLCHCSDQLQRRNRPRRPR